MAATSTRAVAAALAFSLVVLSLLVVGVHLPGAVGGPPPRAAATAAPAAPMVDAPAAPAPPATPSEGTATAALPPQVIAARPVSLADAKTLWPSPAGRRKCGLFLVIENVLYERRMLLRETWLSAAPELLGEGCWKIFTPIEPKEIPEEMTAEVEQWGDTVVFPDNPVSTRKNMKSQGMRHRQIFDWLAENIDPDYVLKVDDDVYLCLPRVVAILAMETTPRERLVWGRPMADFPPPVTCSMFQGHTMHPDPQFVLVSGDIAQQITRQGRKFLRRSKSPIDDMVGNLLQGTLANYYTDFSRILQVQHVPLVAQEHGGCAHFINIHRSKGDEMRKVWEADKASGGYRAHDIDNLGADLVCPLTSFYPMADSSHYVVDVLQKMLCSGDRQKIHKQHKTLQKTSKADKAAVLGESDHVFLAIASTADAGGRGRRAALRALFAEQCAESDLGCAMARVVYFIVGTTATAAAVADEDDVFVVVDSQDAQGPGSMDGMDTGRVLAVWRWAVELGVAWKWMGVAHDSQYIALPRLLSETKRLLGSPMMETDLAILGHVDSCTIDLTTLDGPLPSSKFMMVSRAAVDELLITWPPKMEATLGRLVVTTLSNMRWAVIDDERILGIAREDCKIVVEAADLGLAHKTDLACMENRIDGDGLWHPVGPTVDKTLQSANSVCPSGFFALSTHNHRGKEVTEDGLFEVFCADLRKHPPH